MKISVTAIGLMALAVGLLLVPHAGESTSWLLFLIAALTGLVGVVNAIVARGLSTRQRVAAGAIAAIPPALALFVVVAFTIAILNGGFE